MQWTFDRGTEFLDHAVQSYVHDELQAKTFYTNIESPWENGLAERSFGVLFGITRSFLHGAECPPHLWGFALLHATYIRNRRPSTQFGGQSPMHKETGLPQDLTKLRTFGCPAMIHIRPHPKLASRSQHGIFIGMSSLGNGWNFLIDKSRTFKSIQFVDSLDIKFNELFVDMTGPRNTTMHHGQFFSPPLAADSLTPIQTTAYDPDDADGIVHMSDFRPLATSSVTPTIQPQLPIQNATVPPTVHDQTNVPLTPVASPLAHERPQRRRAPTPRFDIDALQPAVPT